MNMMNERIPIVAIIDSDQGQYLDLPDIEQSILQDIAEVTLYKVRCAEDLAGKIDDADVIISWHMIPLQKKIISRLHQCRGIIRAAVGFDNIDIEFAAQKGIPVCNVPDYGTEEVADHTLALALALIRKLPYIDRYVRHEKWDWSAIGNVPRIRGMKFGIVGFGRIGSAVAKRAQAFGFNVAFFDPYVPSGIEKAHAVTRYETLHDLIEACKVITIHTLLSEETYHLIGRPEFDLMTPETILINTSRGETIDQKALIESLTGGKIGYVGLDVLADEPHVPEELKNSEHAILSAHSAFYADESLNELRHKAAIAARKFLLGQKERSIVNNYFHNHE
jgi:lactate dehydrogenase-like 2-hydroxyacid dehydrogenase